MKKYKEEQVSETCPKCGSNDIDYGAFEVGEAYFPAECLECGLMFKEYYELVFQYSEGKEGD